MLEGCVTDEAKVAKWKEVKMIRIAAKPDITSIPKDAQLKVASASENSRPVSFFRVNSRSTTWFASFRSKWKEVKMIRIAAKPDITSIPKDAELKVNMRLEPTFNENADFVGSEINFGPCGVIFHLRRLPYAQHPPPYSFHCRCYGSPLP